MLNQFIKHQRHLSQCLILSLSLGLVVACASSGPKSDTGSESASERLSRIKKTGTSKVVESPDTAADEQSHSENPDSLIPESENTSLENPTKPIKKPKVETETQDLYDSSTSEYKLPKAKNRERNLPEIDKATKDAYKDALKTMDKGLKNKDFDKALEQFKALDVENTQLSGPSTNIGMIYLHQEKFEEAEAAFKKALTINNENEYAHNNLGLTYRELGKFPEAKQSYQSAIELNPKYAEAYYNLGILAELYLQDIDLAIESFELYKLANRKRDEQVDTWLVDLRNRQQAKIALETQAQNPAPQVQAEQSSVPQDQAPTEQQAAETPPESTTNLEPELEEVVEDSPNADTETAEETIEDAETDSEIEDTPVESE